MRTATKAILALLFLATPLWADVTKEDIRKLATAGISDDVILMFIRANGPVARMSSDDLVDLRSAGVGERVLSVILGGSPQGPALGAPAATQDTAPPPALPQTTFVDYTGADPSPTYATYYSGLPLDYYAPAYSYYYSPWLGACTPSWGCGLAYSGIGCGLGFGFPCYSSCFYPWYGGCYGAFGFGCRSYGYCYRPYGFCGRPFGSFYPGGSFGFGFGHGAGYRYGGYGYGTGAYGYRSYYAASGPVIANHQQAMATRSANMNWNAGLNARAGAPVVAPPARGLESRAASQTYPNPRYSAGSYALPRSYTRSVYNYTPRSYSNGTTWRPQSYAGGNSWRPAPAPHWGGSSSGHGGGWGGGGHFGGGGSGGGGGHGGGGHGGHGR